MLGLWPGIARGEDAPPSHKNDSANEKIKFQSFEEFVAAVRRGQPASADTDAAVLSAWSTYRMSATPEGCETEPGIRATMGEPETVREMAGWKMLDYPAAGWLFVVSPLGHAAAAAYAVVTEGEAESDGNRDAAESLGTSLVLGRLAGYLGEWTGLQFERPVKADGHSAKDTARRSEATQRSEQGRSSPNLFTPPQYDVRDRTLRVIRAAM